MPRRRGRLVLPLSALSVDRGDSGHRQRRWREARQEEHHQRLLHQPHSRVDRDHQELPGRDPLPGVFQVPRRSRQDAEHRTQPRAAREHRLSDLPRLGLQPQPLRKRGRQPRVETDPVAEPGRDGLGLQTDHHAQADQLPALPLGFGRRTQLQTRRHRIRAGRHRSHLRCPHGHRRRRHGLHRLPRRHRITGCRAAASISWARTTPANPFAAATASATTPNPTPRNCSTATRPRIDCTVCHIPTFAKADATDMARDWSTPGYSEAKDKHVPDHHHGRGRGTRNRLVQRNGLGAASEGPGYDRRRRRRPNGRASGLAE